MKMNKITYERVFNLGNYESVRLGVEAQLEEGEKASDCLALLKKNVEAVYAKLYSAQAEGPVGAATLNKQIKS